MQRRRFLQQGLAASAATLLTSASFSQTSGKGQSEPGRPFNLNYAFHDGMFQNHGGKDFVDQIRYAHSVGFRSIEDNGMMGRSAAEQKRIGETLASLGMQMGVFVVSFDNW